MDFESFWLVVMPGLAAIVAAIALLVAIIFIGIPWGNRLRWRNREAKLSTAERRELHEAKLLLARLATEARDDSVLEISLGINTIKEIEALTKALPKGDKQSA